jgi:hypothetical protein
MTSRGRVFVAFAHEQPDTPIENVLAVYKAVAEHR